MKLKTTLLSYGIASIACALVIGSISYWAIHKADASVDAIVTSSEVLRESIC